MGNSACGCPGSTARVIERNETTQVASTEMAASELRQWPVQLHLVPPTAPWFQDSDILVAADCVAFAQGSFHSDLLRWKAVCDSLPESGRHRPVC
jgi:hypothetical protein